MCEEKPTAFGAASAAQLTFDPSTDYPAQSFAGFFSYGSAADFERELAAIKADVAKFQSEKRKPPLVLANAKALVVVVADGEIPAPDRLSKAVSAF